MSDLTPAEATRRAVEGVMQRLKTGQIQGLTITPHSRRRLGAYPEGYDQVRVAGFVVGRGDGRLYITKETIEGHSRYGPTERVEWYAARLDARGGVHGHISDDYVWYLAGGRHLGSVFRAVKKGWQDLPTQQTQRAAEAFSV